MWQNKKNKTRYKNKQNQFIFYIYSKIDNKNWLVTNSERYDTSTTTANIWTQTLILHFHVKLFYPLKCYVNNSFSDWWLVNNCFTDYIHFYICQLCKNTRTVLEMLHVYLIQISSLLHYFIRIVELVSYISVTLSVVRSISFYRWEKMIYTWVRAHRSIWLFCQHSVKIRSATSMLMQSVIFILHCVHAVFQHTYIIGN